MVNLKVGDFEKVRLANGHILDVTGMGDINLVTPLGTIWNLKNVRVIPELKTKLISVGQLDEHGLEVRFGNGKWKVVNGNMVIARGKKRGSLYMVEVPAEGVTVPVKQDKVWFVESKAKKVHFANVKLGAKKMSAECVRKFKPVKRIGDSGSTGRGPDTAPKSRWVLKTKVPTGKFSPGDILQGLESGNGPWCISGSGGVCKPVETKDGSVKTGGLKLGGARETLDMGDTGITGSGLLEWCLWIEQSLQVGDCWVMKALGRIGPGPSCALGHQRLGYWTSWGWPDLKKQGLAALS
ncbi:hypothetical protein L1987_55846 [Smallanthus sonchifolius]|uniref:Uncharacterized protein n=1 Tax=Smallanthus sonchifolius TaxID=185202 RepID=A0ACB9EAT1_9ASTR|nr:hypothetical protein L1987_55846 [Smallanthus sonchifolius]